MFGTLGGPELFLILVLALIVFGPRKLPEIGKSMGRMLAEFRKASTDFKRTLEDEVDADKDRASALSVPPPSPAAPAASRPAPALPDPGAGREAPVVAPPEGEVLPREEAAAVEPK
jgi:TatA/E family protein of Tat protein translocase